MENDLGQVRYEGKRNPIPPELPNTKLHRAPTAGMEEEWALHFASPHHLSARLSQNKFSFQGARNDIFTCRRAVAGFGIKKFLDRSSVLFGVESAGSSSVQSSQLTLMPPQLHLLRNRPKKQQRPRHDKKLSFRCCPTRPGTFPCRTISVSMDGHFPYQQPHRDDPKPLFRRAPSTSPDSRPRVLEVLLGKGRV